MTTCAYKQLCINVLTQQELFNEICISYNSIDDIIINLFEHEEKQYNDVITMFSNLKKAKILDYEKQGEGEIKITIFNLYFFEYLNDIISLQKEVNPKLNLLDVISNYIQNSNITDIQMIIIYVNNFLTNPFDKENNTFIAKTKNVKNIDINNKLEKHIKTPQRLDFVTIINSIFNNINYTRHSINKLTHLISSSCFISNNITYIQVKDNSLLVYNILKDLQKLDLITKLRNPSNAINKRHQIILNDENILLVFDLIDKFEIKLIEALPIKNTYLILYTKLTLAKFKEYINEKFGSNFCWNRRALIVELLSYVAIDNDINKYKIIESINLIKSEFDNAQPISATYQLYLIAKEFSELTFLHIFNKKQLKKLEMFNNDIQNNIPLYEYNSILRIQYNIIKTGLNIELLSDYLMIINSEFQKNMHLTSLTYNELVNFHIQEINCYIKKRDENSFILNTGILKEWFNEFLSNTLQENKSFTIFLQFQKLINNLNIFVKSTLISQEDILLSTMHNFVTNINLNLADLISKNIESTTKNLVSAIDELIDLSRTFLSYNISGNQKLSHSIKELDSFLIEQIEENKKYNSIKIREFFDKKVQEYKKDKIEIKENKDKKQMNDNISNVPYPTSPLFTKYPHKKFEIYNKIKKAEAAESEEKEKNKELALQNAKEEIKKTYHSSVDSITNNFLEIIKTQRIKNTNGKAHSHTL